MAKSRQTHTTHCTTNPIHTSGDTTSVTGEFGSDIFQEFPDDYLATYLFKMPFGLGLDPNRPHAIQSVDLQSLLNGANVAQAETTVFFRLFRAPDSGLRYFPKNINAAALALYDTDLELDVEAHYKPDNAYELWISAETPLRRLPGEADIHARTLERCLRALDLFLRSYRIATRDSGMYPIAPVDVNGIVPVGIRDHKDKWKCLMLLHVCPQMRIPTYPDKITKHEENLLTAVVENFSLGHPFLRGKDLELSAYRQSQALGDLAGAIVTLQTAMEGTLFQLWRMKLVDTGLSDADINDVIGADPSFKTLVTSILPPLLGGSWSVEPTSRSPAAIYWRDLYKLRNDVVHSGAVVQDWQYEIATKAHQDLIVYVFKRLFQKWRTYPRTLTALALARGLPVGMSMPRQPDKRAQELVAESRPFWWAKDLRADDV